MCIEYQRLRKCAMKKTSWKLPLLALILAAGLLGGCSAIESLTGSSTNGDQTPPASVFVGEPTSLTVEGRLVPADSVWMSFQQPGLVADVLVEVGQSVPEGAVLARLGEREPFEAAVKAAELELLSARQFLDDLNDTASLATTQARLALAAAELRAINARQALADLDTDDYQVEIDEAWETVQDEKDALEDAQEEFDRYKDLSEDNANRRRTRDALTEAQKRYDDAVRAHQRLVNALEQARADAALAEAALAQAERDAEERRAGPASGDLALAEARLIAVEAQLAAAETALANRELRAPFAGTVVAVNLTAGEVIGAYQPLMQLADFSSWYVETTDLTEIDVVKIDQARPAVIIPDALPDVWLIGQVERIALGFTEQAGDVLYTVRLRLDGDHPDLRWGMRAAVTFERR
jgi:multidrug resistance efflux pump